MQGYTKVIDTAYAKQSETSIYSNNTVSKLGNHDNIYSPTSESNTTDIPDDDHDASSAHSTLNESALDSGKNETRDKRNSDTYRSNFTAAEENIEQNTTGNLNINLSYSKETKAADYNSAAADIRTPLAIQNIEYDDRTPLTLQNIEFDENTLSEEAREKTRDASYSTSSALQTYNQDISLDTTKPNDSIEGAGTGSGQVTKTPRSTKNAAERSDSTNKDTKTEVKAKNTKLLKNNPTNASPANVLKKINTNSRLRYVPLLDMDQNKTLNSSNSNKYMQLQPEKNSQITDKSTNGNTDRNSKLQDKKGNLNFIPSDGNNNEVKNVLLNETNNSQEENTKSIYGNEHGIPQNDSDVTERSKEEVISKTEETIKNAYLYINRIEIEFLVDEAEEVMKELEDAQQLIAKELNELQVAFSEKEARFHPRNKRHVRKESDLTVLNHANDRSKKEIAYLKNLIERCSDTTDISKLKSTLLTLTNDINEKKKSIRNLELQNRKNEKFLEKHDKNDAISNQLLKDLTNRTAELDFLNEKNKEILKQHEKLESEKIALESEVEEFKKNKTETAGENIHDDIKQSKTPKLVNKTEKKSIPSQYLDMSASEYESHKKKIDKSLCEVEKVLGIKHEKLKDTRQRIRDISRNEHLIQKKVENVLDSITAADREHLIIEAAKHNIYLDEDHLSNKNIESYAKVDQYKVSNIISDLKKDENGKYINSSKTSRKASNQNNNGSSNTGIKHAANTKGSKHSQNEQKNNDPDNSKELAGGKKPSIPHFKNNKSKAKPKVETDDTTGNTSKSNRVSYPQNSNVKNPQNPTIKLKNKPKLVKISSIHSKSNMNKASEATKQQSRAHDNSKKNKSTSENVSENNTKSKRTAAKIIEENYTKNEFAADENRDHVATFHDSFTDVQNKTNGNDEIYSTTDSNQYNNLPVQDHNDHQLSGSRSKANYYTENNVDDNYIENFDIKEASETDIKVTNKIVTNVKNEIDTNGENYLDTYMEDVIENHMDTDM